MVELKNITKDFSGVPVLKGVSLSVRAGEILALVGENGAGKSTLMNILSGTYGLGTYGGEIVFDGWRAFFRTPFDAKKAGIAIIHQELSGFPALTIAENLSVGAWPKRGGLIDWPRLEEYAAFWLKQVGVFRAPSTLMQDLSVGEQQLVEIAKALSQNSKVLILDEPTSSLTPNETAGLFALLRELKAKGVALIYISHKLDEVFALADRVTVLRDGESVFDCEISQCNEAQIISQMVGRSLERHFPERPKNEFSLDAALTARELRVGSLGPLSFEVRRGEILGFAGLLGAGRTELLQQLAKNPRSALRQGIVYVSEDRKAESIFPQRSLLENFSLSSLAKAAQTKFLNLFNERESVEKGLHALKVRYRSEEQSIMELSGGNQQKVVIGRALEAAPEVLILDEPTRGVDVGAKFEIYQILFDLAKSGKALLVISSDLPELMGLADRIIVLRQGQVAGELARSEFSQQKIMSLAVGAVSV